MSLDNSVETLITNIHDRYFQRRDPKNPVPDISFPGQTSTRGLLIPQMAIDNNDIVDASIVFQFNPEEISYNKPINYTSHNRLGFPDEIPFWVSGGAKTISFMLTMMYTAGTNYKNMIMRPNKSLRNDNTTNDAYLNTDDFTSLDDKGLLPAIQKLEALTYPMRNGNTELVKFSNGMADITSLEQFANPPFCLFSYGNVCANVFVIGLERTDKLFNSVLNPIRTEFSVTLQVIAAKSIDKNFVAQRYMPGINSNDTKFSPR